MLEKLNIHFYKDNKKFNEFELEIFIELINNHINWINILEIMELKNDDHLILNKIDKSAYYINEISKINIQKTYRLKWIILRTLNKKWILKCFEKSFLYPIFLWMISINLITFLVIFVLPTTFDIFLTLSGSNEGNKALLLIIQFFIGIEWGVLLLLIINFYTINDKKISNLYIKFYRKNKKNIFVYILSYLYLFDFISLLKLDITFEKILNILKTIDYPMYSEISNHILSKLNEGISLKSSFIYLDSMFEKIISIDDFERKAIERIEDYIFILKKQIEINIKKYAMYFTSFVYIQIGIIVFVVYTVLMYPLKLLEGMNL